MQLQNFSIDRIIIHQIFQRDVNGNKVAPTQSHEYTKFDHSAMEAFKSRVRDALGAGSKAVQMEIVDQQPGEMSALVNEMIDQDDDSFAASSYDIAKKLTSAQHKKGIPGGIVVVFSGKQGLPALKFLGVIKAEIHNGYEKSINEKTNEISLKFVEEVLLTPGTRLYKTAGFFEKAGYDKDSADLNEKWAVMVSDSQINPVDGKAAAQYFYSDFLGCGYLQTSARTTKKFYETASSFISNLKINESEKSDLLNALTTYLKVETSPTASASEFASKYFDVDTQDLFTEYAEQAGLPTAAFTKDVSHIASRLRYRSVNFNSKVKIVGPADTFKDLVTIESIDGDLDESGTPSVWTRVTIKDRISQQE